MTRLKQMPVHSRPREKLFAKGAEALSDRELLAALLGRGSGKRDVLALGSDLLRLIDEKGLDLTVAEITAIPGIGQAGAAAVAAAFEFARRRIRPRGQKITTPAGVMPLIRHYGDRKQEHFIAVSLNGAHDVMDVRVVTIGLVNKSQVHPREVFSDAIAARAAAIIVAHNHPSGDLAPSREDLKVTRRLKEAGEVLGIPLLDHIIFHGDKSYSLADHRQV
jgi:DNA repair protein RadC